LRERSFNCCYVKLKLVRDQNQALSPRYNFYGRHFCDDSGGDTLFKNGSSYVSAVN